MAEAVPAEGPTLEQREHGLHGRGRPTGPTSHLDTERGLGWHGTPPSMVCTLPWRVLEPAAPGPRQRTLTHPRTTLGTSDLPEPPKRPEHRPGGREARTRARDAGGRVKGCCGRRPQDQDRHQRPRGPGLPRLPCLPPGSGGPRWCCCRGPCSSLWGGAPKSGTCVLVGWGCLEGRVMGVAGGQRSAL